MAQRGTVGRVSGWVEPGTSHLAPRMAVCGASQPGNGEPGTTASKDKAQSDCLSLREWQLTPYTPKAVAFDSTDGMPLATVNPMLGQPELPLAFCIDCDSVIAFIPRLYTCAYTCIECGTKLVFTNGSLVPFKGIEKPKVAERRQMLLHVATMEITNDVVKTAKVAENHTHCIDCGEELQSTLSVRVSKFSHVGKRDIKEPTYPYLTKTIYFPVYVKGSLCDTCCSMLTPDSKEIKDKIIGIWRNASGVEINILIPLEVNETIDGQSMKGMDLDIKANREADSKDSFTLLRIDGFDEPVVLAWDYKGTNKVDAQSYNAMFGKRRVNRYGRHVTEPGIEGK